MRNVKPNVTHAASEAPGTVFSPSDIARLDAVGYLLPAAEREGARMIRGQRCTVNRRYVQSAFMGWAYMSFAVSGARPKLSSIVAIRLYWLA